MEILEGTWQISVDTGGTFTDCMATGPNGTPHRLKVLSNGALRGEVLEWFSETSARIKVHWPVNADIFRGYSFRLLAQDDVTGTVATLDPVEQILTLTHPWNGPDTASDFEIFAGEEAPVLAARLLTQTQLGEDFPQIELRLGSTRGTNALLERKGARVALLITKGLEDLLLIGDQSRPDLFALDIKRPSPLYQTSIPVKERLDANGKVLVPLEQETVDRVITEVERSACTSVAIALMHSYRNPVHELQLSKALEEAGIPYISLSHGMSSTAKFLPRTETSVVNAYLSPIIHQYLSGIQSALNQAQLKVMSSAGGLMGLSSFLPKDSLLSGPAGGVVGAREMAQRCGYEKILTLDMGGTSTDVARYDNGFDYVFETKVGPARILSPSVAVETVAAGGGSICRFDGYKLTVGPDSAGSKPGPACYGDGGPLTITDVNLLLDRLDPGQISIPLSRRHAREALQKEIQHSGLSAEEALEGWRRIADETMAQAIRQISIGNGYDATDYVLLAFGGAGGQHACSVAELLNIRQILIPRDAGILSAVGLSQATLERFSTRQVLKPWAEIAATIEEEFAPLEDLSRKALQSEGLVESDIQIHQRLLYLRFRGQDHSLEVNFDPSKDPLKDFEATYRQLYGHWISDQAIELVSIKVMARQKGSAAAGIGEAISTTYQPAPAHYVGQQAVHIWQNLKPGAAITGPAVLAGALSTTFINFSWEGIIDEGGNLRLKQLSPRGSSTEDDPQAAAIRLELFTRRFQSVASEMGALLQRTSFSVNVKERMDFSCALLDSEGELVVNAPHIPVHLGSMGVCTRAVASALDLGPGDIAITNHPAFGGSHLPDVTLVAAVFDEQGQRIGYLANRAHHAEIGGKRPGSMPPDAVNLAEEGVVIPPTYIVRKGEAAWERIKTIFTTGPYPTRNLPENIADLNAGLASIRAGEKALTSLTSQFGTETVLDFMSRLKDYANRQLQQQLKAWPQKAFSATETLDDGTPIQAEWTFSNGAVFLDLAGTGSVHSGNLNANRAIVQSAVLYVLRVLLQEDIPLNEGLMQSVRINLPTSFLNPDFDEDPTKCPAVVGGNVETSQRLVDTLLKALGLSACSQGTMNNFLFGNAEMGYYETIGGGAGAGEGFSGASAVHQHMTNTRITDPEILELRYPVRLEHFGIRHGSGGNGKWKGGDGIIRRIQFLANMEVTLLTQHRVVSPYGLEGGKHGLVGKQTHIHANGIQTNLPGLAKIDLMAGDAIEIETPGGGGYGEPA